MSRANRALTTRLEDVQVGSIAFAPNLPLWSTPRVRLKCSCRLPEEPDQAKQRTQRAGGEVSRGESSEGAVQGHEEQHRGREEAAGLHSGQTPEGSECKPVCGTKTRLLPNPTKSFAELFIYLESNSDKVLNPFCLQRLQSYFVDGLKLFLSSRCQIKI